MTKLGEHLERDVAGQHVGEQPHAVRDRPRQERQHLDEHDQRQDVDRDAARHEQPEEVQAVLVEAVDDHGEEHEQRQRGGDDDVARHREGVGDQPDHVRHQDEHEQREHQREELHALVAGGALRWCWRRTRRTFRRSTACGPAPARARRCRRPAAPQMPTTVITMNSAELVNAISCPPIWPSVTMLVDLELVNRIGHRRVASCNRYRGLCTWPGPLGNSRRAHHVEDAGGKAEQQKHDHPPRRDSEPAVERPADERADQDAGDQFGGEPEAAGERRRIAFVGPGPASTWPARPSAGRAVRRDAGASRRERPLRLTGCRSRSLRACRRPCSSALLSTLRRCEQIQRVPAVLKAARTIVIGCGRVKKWRPRR